MLNNKPSKKLKNSIQHEKGRSTNIYKTIINFLKHRLQSRVFLGILTILVSLILIFYGYFYYQQRLNNESLDILDEYFLFLENDDYEHALKSLAIAGKKATHGNLKAVINTYTNFTYLWADMKKDQIPEENLFKPPKLGKRISSLPKIASMYSKALLLTKYAQHKQAMELFDKLDNNSISKYMFGDFVVFIKASSLNKESTILEFFEFTHNNLPAPNVFVGVSEFMMAEKAQCVKNK